MMYTTIDAHQHYWIYDPVRDSWINNDMTVIRRDFLPCDLEPLIKQNGIEGTVVVQSTHTETENTFHIENAKKNDFIRGIVGWTDLCSPSVGERLEYYRGFPKIKGFRHVLQGEKQRDYMLLSGFKNGIAQLKKYGFTYDILIFADQLGYTNEFVDAFPDQPFVVDHIAKPSISTGEINGWAKGMQAIARHENVYCKISGMVTEADWHNWTMDDFTPYLDVIVESFGTSRIMFGSDWPVCLVAATYEKMKAIVDEYFSSFSADEKENFYGKNATRFYHL
jgi:L-fucono-1,5-lactonase